MMDEYQAGLSLPKQQSDGDSSKSKNPGILWLCGEDHNKLAVIAITLEHVLKRQANLVSLLDEDQFSTGLCQGLGESTQDRLEFVRRVAEVARILDETGLLTIVLVDIKAQDEWNLAREILSFSRFSTAYIESTRLWKDECRSEDSTSGIIETVQPEHAELHIQSDNLRVEDVVNGLLAHLNQRGSLKQGYSPIGGRLPHDSDKAFEGEAPIAVAAG